LKHTYTIEFSKNIILTETEERFLLYKKYEQAIHKEKEKDITLKSYNDSWGNSIFEKNKNIKFYQNFKELTPHPEFYPDCYGTYNLIHRIDNKIVAVTVIDILPHMLISDYCYYDPDYSFLDLGVVTVIREIEYMKSFNILFDGRNVSNLPKVEI
jgi:arginine-tRNA-protein transferase